MRVAALYDIHGNLLALKATLEEVQQAGVDQIVVGGDVVPGPMPRHAVKQSSSRVRPQKRNYCHSLKDST